MSTAEHAPTHDPDSNYLGSIALVMPGKSKPVALGMSPIGQTGLAVTHAVSDADLAVPGNWFCEVTNSTVGTITFDTNVALHVPQQVIHKTATFDLELLNVMIAEAFTTAQVGFQLNSSGSDDDKRSVVTWSDEVGKNLPDPNKGLTAFWFHIPDYRAESDVGIGSLDIGDFTFAVIRFSGIDSDPDTPITAMLTASDGGEPQVVVSITLKPDSASATAIDSDANLDELGIEFDLATATIDVTVGFDAASVGVQADFQGTLKVAGLSFSIGDDLSTSVQEPVGGWTSDFNSVAVRGYIDSFFVDLMRLGQQVTILGYSTDGTTLTVSYQVPAPLPVHPVFPVVAETGPALAPS